MHLWQHITITCWYLLQCIVYVVTYDNYVLLLTIEYFIYGNTWQLCVFTYQRIWIHSNIFLEIVTCKVCGQSINHVITVIRTTFKKKINYDSSYVTLFEKLKVVSSILLTFRSCNFLLYIHYLALYKNTTKGRSEVKSCILFSSLLFVFKMHLVLLVTFLKYDFN